jgi:hypothetical protein
MESVQQVATYDTLNIFELVIFLLSDYPAFNAFYDSVIELAYNFILLIAVLDDYIDSTVEYITGVLVTFSNFCYKHVTSFENKVVFFYNGIYEMCASYNGFIVFFGFFVFTNIFSFFFQNYLGMYGIFFFNLFSLLLF